MLRQPLGHLLLSTVLVRFAAGQSLPKTVINYLPETIENSLGIDHQRRAAYFSNAVISGPDLDTTDPAAREHLVRTMYLADLPELPAAKADTIVLGTISSLQPYLTSNHKAVFTEISVNVETVFAHSVSPLPSALTITALGGFLRLPNGWVADTDVEGTGSPLRGGGRYLLFLNYDPKAAAFRIVKGWELMNNTALAMAPDDLTRVKNSTSRLNGIFESSFLAAVRQSVQSASK
jgi:hypothetical protein